MPSTIAVFPSIRLRAHVEVLLQEGWLKYKTAVYSGDNCFHSLDVYVPLSMMIKVLSERVEVKHTLHKTS